MTSNTSLYSIICGVWRCNIGGVKYEVKAPTYKDILRSEEFADELLLSLKFENWLSEEDAFKLLVSKGVCEPKSKANLEKLNDTIDDLKVALYDSILAPKEHSEIKKRLGLTRETQTKLMEKLSAFDHMVLDTHIEFEKQRFLIKRQLWCGKKKVKVDDFSLNIIIGQIAKKKPNLSGLRKFARSEPWRSLWNIRGADNFVNKCLTDEQRALTLFSKMYDGIYENPESPSDDIINDDDLLDGWMIKQKREREKDRMNKKLEDSKVYERHQGAKEIFIPVKNEKERKAVENLNDVEARIIKKQREVALNKSGVLLEKDLPDVKQDIQMQKNQRK